MKSPTAQVVEQARQEAIAAERERCAKIVERRAKAFASDAANELEHLAHCIRQGRYVSGELAK